MTKHEIALRASSLNMPIDVYLQWEKDRKTADLKKEEAKKMLAHAFYGTEHINEEQSIFLDTLLKLIIDAAAYEARAGKLFSLYNPIKSNNDE